MFSMYVFFSASLDKAYLIITILFINRQQVVCISDLCKWGFLRAATSPLLPKQPKLLSFLGCQKTLIVEGVASAPKPQIGQDD